ncbi:MAG: hypothetical protein WAM58_11710, partial [Candidatus Acidiferrum sp.]
LQWSLVEVASRLLEREEREAVLGDLAEAQENAWNGLFGVMGLVVRRQALLWKSWRPWMAGFAVALPSSFLLMGASLSVSWSYQRLLCPELLKAASLTKGSGLLVLLCQVVLLIGWSWTGGYVVGAASRRTLWASALLCYSPCLFCLSRFRVESLSRYCLLLFLVPAIWGVRQGLRSSRMRLHTALVLALAVTALTFVASGSDGQHLWSAPRLNLDWALSLPAWFLVATSRRPEGIAVRN